MQTTNWDRITTAHADEQVPPSTPVSDDAEILVVLSRDISRGHQTGH
jgi:hypothetical protein